MTARPVGFVVVLTTTGAPVYTADVALNATLAVPFATMNYCSIAAAAE